VREGGRRRGWKRFETATKRSGDATQEQKSDSKSCAGNVFVFDLLWLFGLVAGEVVGVPDDRFGGDFRMLAQVFERVSRGGGIVLLVGELGRLDGGFLFLAQAAVEDGELIVAARSSGSTACRRS